MSTEIESREEAIREFAEIVLNTADRSRESLEQFHADGDTLALSSRCDQLAARVDELWDLGDRLLAPDLAFRLADALHRLRASIRLHETLRARAQPIADDDQSTV